MKVMYDTCLYVDLLRAGLHMDLFSSRNQLRYMSAIVMLELRAGTANKSSVRTVDRLLTPYIKANRIILPQQNHYYLTGACATKLSAKGHNAKALLNDILIAICAKSVGATLFTSNKRDYEVIRKEFSFPVEYVSQTS